MAPDGAIADNAGYSMLNLNVEFGFYSLIYIVFISDH